MDRKVLARREVAGRIGRLACAAVALLGWNVAGSASAQDTYTVNSATTFYNALQSIDANPTHTATINITSSFTMTGPVLAIDTSSTVTVVGGGYTIDGGSAYRPFFVESGSLVLQNLTINHGSATGGAGGGSAGGGMGAGGAVFVDSGGSLTVQNVAFTNNSATGGSGAATGTGGGGGLGGAGGTTGGGGGGLYGAGGSALGGGGGELGNGGNGDSLGGGGGGGQTAAGGAASSYTGGAGGGAEGGAGGNFFTPPLSGANGSAGGGGGGSGSIGSTGGAGGLFGGGGAGGQFGDGGQGGAFGGGGAGGTIFGGGNGGFGGGGGSGGTLSTGGAGGFGGGGGAGENAGAGGFGGGAGAGTSGGEGGGGAAFGGAIFVNSGGSLSVLDTTVSNGVTFTGSAVTGGAGANAGSTDGTDFFLASGVATTFNIGSGLSQTISDPIGNNDGTMNAGATIDKTGAGVLSLTGNSPYVSATTIDAGMLLNSGALGGTMTVNNTGAFINSGSIAGLVTINSGGETTNSGTLTAGADVLSGGVLNNSGVANTVQINNGAIVTNTGSGTMTLLNNNDFGALTNSGTISNSAINVQGTSTSAASLTNSGTVGNLTLANQYASLNNSGTGGTLYVSQGAVAGNTGTLGVATVFGTLTNSGAGVVGSSGGNVVENTGVVTNVATMGDTTIDSGGNLTNGAGGTIGAVNDYGTFLNSGSTGNVILNPSVTMTNYGSMTSVTLDTGAGLFNTGTVGATTVESQAVVNNTGTLGATNIQSGGTVNTAGTLGATTVAAGGTLAGYGTLGNTTVDGTITATSAAAQFTVNGTYAQASGSTYDVSVTPSTSSKIAASGAATLTGGTVDVTASAGTYVPGKIYTILSASSVSGQYTSLIAPTVSGYQQFELIYTPTAVELELTGSTNFAANATTPNQLAVAGALDTISPTASGALLTEIQYLLSQSPTTQRAVFNGLSGEIYASISAIELQTTTVWMQFLSNRLAREALPGPGPEEVGEPIRTVSGGKIDAQIVYVVCRDGYDRPVVLPRLKFLDRLQCCRPSWRTWAQGYGLGGIVKPNAAAGGAGGLNYGLGGTIAGIDAWLTDEFMIGSLFGYAGTNLGDASTASNARISGEQFGAYELFTRRLFYFSNVDALSTQTYDVNREFNFASASAAANGLSSGSEYAHYSEAGFTLGGPRVRLQPFAGMQYIYLGQHDFYETGNGLGLNVNGQHTNSARGSFGSRVYLDYVRHNVRFTPTVQGRYQHEFADGTHLITSSFQGAPTVSFVTAGNNLGRDFALFTAGLNVATSARTAFWGGYDLQWARNYTGHIGSFGYQFCW